MKRRTRRSLAASLTALVLLAVCALVAVAAIQRLIGEQSWLDYYAVASALHTVRWTAPVVVATSGAVAILGLILLLAGLLPGAVRVLPLSGTPDSGVSRTGYRGALRSAVLAVDGVATAKVSGGAGRVTVRAATARSRPDGLGDAVRAAVEERLNALTLARRPAVKVKIRTTREDT